LYYLLCIGFNAYALATVVDTRRPATRWIARCDSK